VPVEADHQPQFDVGLTRAEWVLLLVLAAVQFTHSMDFMIIMPLGPRCRSELVISPRQFALVVGAYGFAAALGGLLAAWFIDRLDRKTALLVLYAGFTSGTLLCALAPGYWTLVFARSLAGLFGGVVAAIVLVIIGDAFPEIQRGRATGVVMTAFSVASIAGLPAGILLGDRFGVRTPFAVLGGFSAVVLMLAYRILPPLRGHLAHRDQSSASTWAVLVQPAHLRAYAFMIMLVMGTFLIAPHFSDYLVHNVGRSQSEVAYVYLCGGALTFITLPLLGRAADRLGKLIVFRVMAVFTMLTLLVITNLPASRLGLVLIITTMYWVFTSGRWVPAMAMITSSVVPRYRGSFMSVNASVQQMAIGVASVLAGAVVGESVPSSMAPCPASVLLTAGATAAVSAPALPTGSGLAALLGGVAQADAVPTQLTGYALAGVLAAIATVASIVLGGRVRPPRLDAEAEAAVDAPAAVAVAASATSPATDPCPPSAALRERS
jgi:predicted MFS family arabinose efflux permease